MKDVSISYPCDWSFRIIGFSNQNLMESLNKLLVPYQKEFKLKESNSSKAGKYISLNLEMKVDSEKERNDYYGLLKSVDGVKMIL